MSAILNRADAQPNPKLPLSWDDPNASHDTPPAPAPAHTPPAQEPAPAPVTPADTPHSDTPAMPTPQATTVADTPPAQEPALAPTTPETPASPQDRRPGDDDSQSPTDHLTEQPADDQPPAEPAVAEPRPEEPSAEIVSYRPPEETVSKTLQRIRAEAGVSISEVSHKTHISATFISDLEAANFTALPDLDQCLDKIRQLCTEYGADTEALLEKFRREYADVLKDSQQEPEHANAMGRRPNAGVIRATGLSTTPQRMASLPSLILLGVILLLAAILLYAFFAYQSRRLPPRTDTDFTQFVPAHRPQVILLDEQR
ncbi:MAG: helix-turn-helix domain-containing protein [Oligosphaeraceae bacterium]